MPLWVIYHPETAFQDAPSKKSLSEAITSLYTSFGLPAFYVVVLFNQIPTSSIFIGGRTEQTAAEEEEAEEKKAPPPFIRFQIDQIAVRMEQRNYTNWIARIDDVLRPHVQDKGYDWEYHITETERGLWKINGLAPPPFRGESEKEWARLNRAVPWEEGGVKEPAERKGKGDV